MVAGALRTYRLLQTVCDDRKHSLPDSCPAKVRFFKKNQPYLNDLCKIIVFLKLYSKRKMIRFVKIFCFAGICLSCHGELLAQSLEQAKRLYLAGKYAEAKPMFEKLVKQAPNNASYNHWYGVCCLETGDRETAESYLKISAGRRVQESYRYLGELYIHAYRFDEAAGMYREYIEILSKKNEDIEPYKKKLALAEKAQRMVEKVENIQSRSY
jgi:tetratricopeptide (TPR) repeat protein